MVRHGEAAASWGQSADPGLSPLGEQQAKETAWQLREELASDSPRIVSSPLLRAQETAAPLARLLKGNVEIDKRFREIPSSAPLAERQDWLRGFMREEWSTQNDLLMHWKQGIIQAVEALPANTVVFTHFLVLNTLVGHYQGDAKTLVYWPDNASVTTLCKEAGEISVDELGKQMKTVVNL